MTGWTMDRDGSPGPALRQCLEAAVKAPSIHNTQPWLFRVDGAGVDVLADPTRRLAVVDPRGRELLLSVGAALLNLRVAILAHGRQPITRMFPTAGVVARVMPGPPRPRTRTVRELARAILVRRTSRRPFADIAVADQVLDELAQAARAEGAVLTVADGADRDTILSLVRTADCRWSSRPAYWAELADWTLATTGRTDGVPPEVFGPWSAAEAIPLRDFGLVQFSRHRNVARFESEPTIVVLYAAGDDPDAWVRAGQALERVLLTATVRGLSTTPMSQPLEVPELRALLADPAYGLTAQAVLRVGYGPPCPPSPRRALHELLVDQVAV